MAKRKTKPKKAVHAKQSVACEDNQDVYRTLFELDDVTVNGTKQVSYMSYLLRPEKDHDGHVSVTFSIDDSKGLSPQHCCGVAMHVAKRIREIAMPDGSNANLDVFRDTDKHGHIEGISWPPPPPLRGLAHYLAGQLAKQAEIVWAKEDVEEN